jgi:DnaJ family protein C protein 2
MTRIRQVVDNAYAADPRISLFKQEDLRKKQEYKQGKRNVFKQKELEEEAVRYLLLYIPIYSKMYSEEKVLA